MKHRSHRQNCVHCGKAQGICTADGEASAACRTGASTALLSDCRSYPTYRKATRPRVRQTPATGNSRRRNRGSPRSTEYSGCSFSASPSCRPSAQRAERWRVPVQVSQREVEKNSRRTALYLRHDAGPLETRRRFVRVSYSTGMSLNRTAAWRPHRHGSQCNGGLENV
jgi:hypothetical protein